MVVETLKAPRREGRRHRARRLPQQSRSRKGEHAPSAMRRAGLPDRLRCSRRACSGFTPPASASRRWMGSAMTMQSELGVHARARACACRARPEPARHRLRRERRGRAAGEVGRARAEPGLLRSGPRPRCVPRGCAAAESEVATTAPEAVSPPDSDAQSAAAGSVRCSQCAFRGGALHRSHRGVRGPHRKIPVVSVRRSRENSDRWVACRRCRRGRTGGRSSARPRKPRQRPPEKYRCSE